MFWFKTYRKLILLLPLFLFFSCAENPDNQKAESELLASVVYLRDPSNSISPKEILDQENLGKFEKPVSLNFGFERCNFWAIVAVNQKIVEKYDYLSLMAMRLYGLEYYAVHSSKMKPIPLEKWTFQNLLAIENLENADSIVVFVPMKTYIPQPLNFEIKVYQSKEKVLSKDQFALALTIFFNSFIVISIIVSLYFYWSSKRNYFLLYPITLLSYGVFIFWDTGVGRILASENQYILLGAIPNVYWATLYLPVLLSSELPWIPEKTKRVFYVIGGISVLSFLFFFFFNTLYFPDLMLIQSISIATSSSVILFYYRKTWMKSTKEIIFVLAICTLMIFGPIKIYHTYGWITNQFTEYGFMITVFLELILWTIYFVLVIKETNKESIQVSQALLQEEQALSNDIMEGRDQERAKLNQYTLEELLPKFEKLKISLNQDSNLGAKEIEAIIEEIRYLSRLYISPNIAKNGLEKEIRRYISLLENLKGVNIYLEYHFENEEDQNDFNQLNFYRVLQEGINNALIHHQADSIHVQFLSFDENLLVNIEDDGQQNEINTTTISEIQNRLSDFEHQIQESPIYGSGNRLEMEIQLSEANA